MSLQELLTASFDYQTNNLYTAAPGIVVAVRNNLEELSVDVQPTTNILNKDKTTKGRPVVLNVPVQMPSSSVAALTFPVNVGDPVLLVYSMRSLDVWKRSEGRPTVPSDNRKFDKRDCFAIPGVWPFGRSINKPSVRIWQHNTNDLVITNNIGTGSENEVRLKADGNIVINTNQDVEVNCNNASVVAQANIDMVCETFSLDTTTINITASSASINIADTTWSGNISQSGNYTGTGVQTFNGVVFSSHVHGSSPGPS